MDLKHTHAHTRMLTHMRATHMHAPTPEALPVDMVQLDGQTL